MRSFRLLSIILCAAVILGALSSCNQDIEHSEAVTPDVSEGGESASEASDILITSDQAYDMLYALLERDRKIVNIFIGASLFGDGSVNASNPDPYTLYPLKAASKYYKFSALENELESIYQASSGAVDAFLSYPAYGVRAIADSNGKTYASSHGAYDFDYPENEEFTLRTITFTSALFYFPYGEKNYSISVDLSTGKLSDSVYLIVSSQYTGPWEKNPALDACQNSASADRLSGSVLVINVFLNDAVSTWTAPKRTAALKLQAEGYAIIENEAQKYNAALELTVTDMSNSLIYKHKNKIGTEPEDTIWINEMFAYTTYGSLDNYIAAYFDVTSYDAYCICFFVNRSGESYSVCCSDESFEMSIYKTERCIMFCVPGEGSISASPAVFARELLHMFGAQYLDSSAAARSYFPNDLMTSVNGSEINDYTAFRIGWKNSIDSFLGDMIQ